MAILESNSIKSNSSSFNSPITFQTSGGTENGKLVRAWVNFNGQGTVAIRGSFNVSSISDLGTGKYAMNMTNALSGANFAFFHSASDDNAYAMASYESGTYATRGSNYVQMYAYALGVGIRDCESACMAVFL